MFNTDDFQFEFEYQESEDTLLREIYESEIEHSMRWSYNRIEKIGVDKWFQIFPYHPEKKMRILENMMFWFADPSREEYEKSAFLKKGLEEIKSIKKETSYR
jgi:hypothetical protein